MNFFFHHVLTSVKYYRLQGVWSTITNTVPVYGCMLACVRVCLCVSLSILVSSYIMCPQHKLMTQHCIACSLLPLIWSDAQHWRQCLPIWTVGYKQWCHGLESLSASLLTSWNILTSLNQVIWWKLLNIVSKRQRCPLKGFVSGVHAICSTTRRQWQSPLMVFYVYAVTPLLIIC